MHYICILRNAFFMNKTANLFILFFILSISARSQLMPKEGAQLNYRLIGFSFPEAEKTGNYILEIAKGDQTNPESFKKHLITTISTTTNRAIVEVPSFGQDYTWRYVSANKEAGSLHHFKTNMAPNVDTAKMRLRIIKEAEKYKDAYLFTDGNMVLYDMAGHPLWYLPNVEGLIAEGSDIRDIKISPFFTITFINGTLAYEINYNGDILWKGPMIGKVNKDKEEYFHHEMTRLSNGHYMILGNEFAQPKVMEEDDDDNIGKPGFKPIRMVHFGTVIEYDHEGNVVWSWKSSKFLKDKLLYYPTIPNTPNENAPHENAFYFNEKTKMLYVSFRNISQVIKVKYPEGNIVATYGNILKPGDEKNSIFCEQHSCKITSRGYLTIFNNNICGWPQSKPKLEMFSEPENKSNELKKIWEYEAGPEVSSALVPGGVNKTSGGNLVELPDQSFFASMCSPFANIFIVDRDKQIRWNALPEKRSADGKSWVPAGQYRANIVTDPKQLEGLIWGGNK
jgi:hypothetical protein